MILQNKSNCSLGILSNPKHSLGDRLAELFVKLVPKQFLLVVHLYNLISGRYNIYLDSNTSSYTLCWSKLCNPIYSLHYVYKCVSLSFENQILNKLVPKQFLLLLSIHLYNLVSGRLPPPADMLGYSLDRF